MHIVFTDLDGTLLDHHTYSYEKALEGMEILERHRAALVLVSSKTFEEMSLLHSELRLDSPLIFENGSGIAYYNKDSWKVEISGRGIDFLKEHVDLIEQTLSKKIMLITDMNEEEISSLTGLSHERAALSKKRRATLPFIVNDKGKPGFIDMQQLNEILKEYNISVTKGGRFYHIIPGGSDKGTAVKKIIKWYTRGNEMVKTLAFGDSENDIPFFKSVNTAFIVRKHDGSVLKHDLIEAVVTEEIGPAGFTEGIKKYFS